MDPIEQKKASAPVDLLTRDELDVIVAASGRTHSLARLARTLEITVRTLDKIVCGWPWMRRARPETIARVRARLHLLVEAAA